MEINKEEYENMIVESTKKVYTIISLTILVSSFLISFLINYIDNKDFWFDFIICLIISVIFYFVAKKSMLKALKKQINQLNINQVEQQICEEKITQKTIKEDGSEINGEIFYKDIIRIKEDKYNFYLYLTKQNILMVSKGKLENIDSFRTMLHEKCVNIIK